MLNKTLNIMVNNFNALYEHDIVGCLLSKGIYAYAEKCRADTAADIIISKNPDIFLYYLSEYCMDIIICMKKVLSAENVSTRFVIVSDIRNGCVEQIFYENGASCFITAPFENDKLYSVIQSLMYSPVSICNKNLKQKITRILVSFGISPRMKGYHYIRSALINEFFDRSCLKNITKELYPKIANEYGTSPQNVERDIRYAIDTAWKNRNSISYDFISLDKINSLESKPTNFEFIAFISDILRIAAEPPDK